MRRGIGAYASVAFLTAAWCALWREFSAANLLSGVAVSFVATVAFGPRSRTQGVSLPNLARLLALVGRDLVNSTVSVAREVLTPTDYTDEQFLDIELEPQAVPHLLLLTVAITLTPGTAVVDVDRHRGLLRIHLLHAHLAQSTTEHVRQLSELAILALPQRETA